MSIDTDTWEKAGDDPKASAAIMKYLVRKLFGRLFISSSKPSKSHGRHGVFTPVEALDQKSPIGQERNPTSARKLLNFD